MSNVCVVAMGKIGLPLAVAIAQGPHRVIGADIDADVVNAVNEGRPPFPNEHELDSRLRAVVRAGTLTATTDTSAAVGLSDVVVVVVPLVVDSDARPDFSAIDAATRDVAAGLQPGMTVIYETTLPVHTTRRRFAPVLAEGSGLTLGEDLFVAHSPERVFSGRIFADLRRYPKLVGGTDARSTASAVEFYESFLEFDERPDLDRPNGVWDLGTAEAAEMAKLAETTYRDLNIAFANQLALGAESIRLDVAPIIEACNSQPFSHIHRPGIAVGGHCIPVYPHLLAGSVPEVTLAAAGREVNSTMPANAVRRIEREFGSLLGADVLILGMSYRAGVKEHAFSGTFELDRLLRERGARPTVLDPLYDDSELLELGVQPYSAGEPVEILVVQADHDEFASLTPEDFRGVQVVYDGRRSVQPDVWAPATVLGPGLP